jgi:hypothetical protein
LEYGLAGKEDHNGWICFEIQRGCYGLPQAGILANNLLHGWLEKEGYYKAATTPGILKHKWWPIHFCLIVNDFGVEDVGIEHFNHLLADLQWYHQVQTNMAMTGDKIVGLNVRWDFPSKLVHINMKSYVTNLLLNLNWPMPQKPQLLPFTETPIAYGQKPSTHQAHIHWYPCCQNTSNAFKKLSGPYCIIDLGLYNKPQADTRG